MTLYRIHPDRMKCQLMTISSDEVEEKLGHEFPFHIDPTPRPYSRVWKTLEIDFYDSTNGNTSTELPDITVDGGKLFITRKALNNIKPAIGDKTECLPVTYHGNEGYILNVLDLAEDYDALDTKCSVKNEWGDLTALGFDETKLECAALFRCAFEGYMGLFCNDSFKALVEDHALRGITFSEDLGNIFPPDPSAQPPASH